ncbi:MAG TPA: alginate lyase family protein [Agriterribacter sp.]|nr:alginate lyase family protein [Agriterribacter sp.]
MLKTSISGLLPASVLLFIFLSSSSPHIACSQDKRDAPASPDWREVTSVEALWQHYPDRVRTLFAALNLTETSLQPVLSHAMKGDTIAAAKALLEHYRESHTADWLLNQSLPGNENELLLIARRLLEDSATIQDAVVKIPKQEDGGWTWKYEGPDHDAEFGYSLNGHKYFVAFLSAWKATKDEAYIKTFDHLIRDWVIHNPLPPETDSIYRVFTSKNLDWRDLGEVVWRDLEAGNRMGISWPQTFYRFQQSDAFTPAARLIMLSGIVEHAEYIQKYHKKGHNWTTMEMNGLGLVGLTFPELKQANEWADYAMQVMETEIGRQVYPDGVQTELSTKTHWVALSPFETIADNFKKAGRSVKQSYTRRLEEMYNYLAYSMRPDGHQPLNNDADREDMRPRVLKAAQTFHRADWEWIATNGSSGEQPKGLPSIVFPWAGINVMRSGWDGQAQWTFFDAGPFGTGHQHSDMLHLSIFAFGKDLLVDGGHYTHKDYFSFDPTIWRGYFRSSFSHNVILVDGKGQNAGPLRATAALQDGVDYMNTPAFDYARGTFSSGYNEVAGKVEHTRSIVYVKEKCWLVVDHIETDRPRTLQALWHYAPSCSVSVSGERTASENTGEGNIEIVPVGKSSWKVEIVKGQEKPFIQGWYSAKSGEKVPNAAVVYTQNIQKSTTFAWVLVTAKGKVPKMKTKIIHQDEQEMQVRVDIENQQPVTVTVPMHPGPPQVQLN